MMTIGKCGAMCVGLVVLVGGMSAMVWGEEAKEGEKLPFKISKETTGITEPLRADGAVDYVKALNEKYGEGVKAQENAFVAWLGTMGARETGDNAEEILEQMARMCGGHVTKQGWTLYEDYLRSQGVPDKELWEESKQLQQCATTLWTSGEHPQLAAFLQQVAKKLDEVDEVVACPRWWMPCVPRDGRSILSVRGYSDWVRDVGRSLCARAMLRAEAGDMAGFLADMERVSKLSGLVVTSWSVHDRIVGMMLARDAQAGLARVAGSGKLTAENCGKAMAIMRAAKPMPSMADVVDIAERWVQLDGLTIIATNTGEEAEGIARSYLALNEKMTQNVDWNIVLRRFNEKCDLIVKALREPDATKMQAAMQREMDKLIKDKISAMDADESPLKFTRSQATILRQKVDLICGNIVPDWSRLEQIARSSEMERQMTIALIAAATYRAEKGKFPEKLGELVPGHLAQVPKDIFSDNANEEVSFSSTADGAAISSVGYKSHYNSGKRQKLELGVKGN